MNDEGIKKIQKNEIHITNKSLDMKLRLIGTDLLVIVSSARGTLRFLVMDLVRRFEVTL
jgi:hypothetical protein